jgi:hypothetical protein
MLNKNVFDFNLVSENSNWLRLDLNFVPLRIFRNLKNRKIIISLLKSGHFCQLEREWLTTEKSCINEMFRNYSYGGNWTDLKVIPKLPYQNSFGLEPGSDRYHENCPEDRLGN